MKDITWEGSKLQKAVEIAESVSKGKTMYEGWLPESPSDACVVLLEVIKDMENELEDLYGWPSSGVTE
jgi:hypothetical protein